MLENFLFLHSSDQSKTSTAMIYIFLPTEAFLSHLKSNTEIVKTSFKGYRERWIEIWDST